MLAFTIPETPRYHISRGDLDRARRALERLRRVESGAQMLSLWAWTEDTTAPIASVEIPSDDPQTCVRFHRQDASQVLTNGRSRVRSLSAPRP